MSAQFPKEGCTQFAVLIQCHDSTGCDEMGDYDAIKETQ